MTRRNRSDPGIPGTARYRRVWELCGKKQFEIGRLCKPPLAQSPIHDFEVAKHRLTWDQARRLAPGYFPDEWAAARNQTERQHAVILKIWNLWFANALAYGSDAMKYEAGELARNIGGNLFEVMPLFRDVPTNEARADVTEIPRGVAETQREAGA